MQEQPINDFLRDDMLMTVRDSNPWYANIVNYMVSKYIPLGENHQHIINIPFDVIDTSSHRAITLRDDSGDEVLHKYTTPTATPSTPKEERFCIMGVRIPSGRYGKGLLRPLTASENEGATESRSPPPMKVKHHLTPPPIVRAPSKIQEDEVKSPEPSVHKLTAQVKKLRKENIELRDRNTELGVELAEIRNNVGTLSRSLCAKIKRAFIEMEGE
uniref:Uncharacterized protein n=2 Tax=Oryza sativa subsp. japonica TaxID=39947 RepID=Q6AV76_ORYSJ|nr:hypothetical protein [Oryza sativa Japonica Group]ABF96887.1 hypothetical protein LOC_Os03g33000 [Oryza sativa Japonica Group]